jgi:hypothetical protein
MAKKPKDNNKYLNALKLADEVSAAFGRPTLNQMLKKHIDDDNHKPNGLFQKTIRIKLVGCLHHQLRHPIRKS